MGGLLPLSGRAAQSRYPRHMAQGRQNVQEEVRRETHPMTPTPWAQAVEAASDVAFLVNAGCCCDYVASPCRACVAAMLRAAAPHLLRATVDGMTDEDVAALDDTLTADAIRRLRERSGTPERKGAEYRAALLAALTAAAGRVGG